MHSILYFPHLTHRVPSGLRVVSKKKHLIDRLNQPDLPPSYTSNTSKEETILEYVEDFRRQFVQVFPERRPLLLCPLNEAGVRKFVCTTVRPTLLPYNSVYNLKVRFNNSLLFSFSSSFACFKSYLHSIQSLTRSITCRTQHVLCPTFSNTFTQTNLLGWYPHLKVFFSKL